MLATLKAFGVPTGTAEADAEGTKHYVSETPLEAVRRFLDKSIGSPGASKWSAAPARRERVS